MSFKISPKAPKKEKLKNTQEQQAIIDFWKNETGNLLIEAGAGTGKTTTLIQLMGADKGSCLFTAFNKSIQKEIEVKIRDIPQARATTLHSLGYSLVRKHCPMKVNVYSNYVWQILDLVVEDVPEEWKLVNDSTENLDRTILNINQVLRQSEALVAPPSFTDLFWEEVDIKPELIGDDYSTDRIEKAAESIWDSFYRHRERHYANRRKTLDIDFLDMVYLPVKWGLSFTSKEAPDYLFVDECQDLNPLQHAFLDLLIPKVKRFAAVGDPRQAIYGFAGAHSDSFYMFFKKPNVTRLPLSLCFRCDTSIVNAANEVHDFLEPFKKDEGIVEFLPDKKKAMVEHVKNRDMVICRNVRPLIELYYVILKKGIPVYIDGRDMLKPLFNYLQKNSRKHYSTMVTELADEITELEKLVEEEKKTQKKSSFNSVTKRALYKLVSIYEILTAFGEANQKVSESTGVVILTIIDGLLKKKDNAVRMSTIHKSKGLESDRVFIVDEWLMPDSRADYEQEMNLKYVARTRAKHSLFIVGTPPR